MRGIVTWFVNNSVPSNLFMFFLIVGGFFISYPSIKAELFPTPDPKAVTIVVPYPGASASEVEASISSKIDVASFFLRYFSAIMSLFCAIFLAFKY